MRCVNSQFAKNIDDYMRHRIIATIDKENLWSRVFQFINQKCNECSAHISTSRRCGDCGLTYCLECLHISCNECYRVLHLPNFVCRKCIQTCSVCGFSCCKSHMYYGYRDAVCDTCSYSAPI